MDKLDRRKKHQLLTAEVLLNLKNLNLNLNLKLFMFLRQVKANKANKKILVKKKMNQLNKNPLNQLQRQL